MKYPVVRLCSFTRVFSFYLFSAYISKLLRFALCRSIVLNYIHKIYTYTQRVHGTDMVNFKVLTNHKYIVLNSHNVIRNFDTVPFFCERAHWIKFDENLLLLNRTWNSYIFTTTTKNEILIWLIKFFILFNSIRPFRIDGTTRIQRRIYVRSIKINI